MWWENLGEGRGTMVAEVFHAQIRDWDVSQ